MVGLKLLQLLCPNYYLQSVFSITVDMLRDLGINGLIVDLDNTLLPWRSSEPCHDLNSWMEQLKAANIGVCIVSNNLSDRVSTIAGCFDMPWIAKAGKPGKRSFVKGMEHLNTTQETTAVVGDQIFTDILGGNRLGLTTILVRPRSKKEFPGTKIVRLIERIVLRLLQRNDMIVDSWKPTNTCH